MEANHAINLARLWRAGKMIGGDQDQVIDALLSEVDRLRAIAHEHWHIVHDEYCGRDDCTSKGGTRECHAVKPVGIEAEEDMAPVSGHSEDDVATLSERARVARICDQVAGDYNNFDGATAHEIKRRVKGA